MGPAFQLIASRFVLRKYSQTIAVDLIRAGLDVGLQNCAGRVTKLRAEVACLQAEFGKRIRRRAHNVARAVQEVDQIRIVVDSVEDEVVLLGALTVRHEVAAARSTGVPKGWRNAICQLRDVDPVSSVERRVIDLLGADHLADGGVLGLEKRRFGINFHRLGNSRLPAT